MRRFGFREHDRGVSRCGFVIADDTLWLGRFVGGEVVRPAKSDGLIPELDIDVEWAA